ncbi:MAG: hypothetical protein U0V56_06985 [Actinomycetota bacterium]
MPVGQGRRRPGGPGPRVGASGPRRHLRVRGRALPRSVAGVPRDGARVHREAAPARGGGARGRPGRDRRAVRGVGRRQHVLRRGRRGAGTVAPRRRPDRAALRLLPDPRPRDVRACVAVPRDPGRAGFHPALELWSAVLSRPEPGLAFLGFGKRDAPHDLELPIPTHVRASDGAIRPTDGAMRVLELNDQHAYVEVAEGFALEPGDVVACGISHPCTAFDKWRVLPVLDDEDRVIAAVSTVF